ncbi:MAG TPA: MFS transporter [Candidatus Eisenbacteria bacterium]|nr:MFS transporter [Candidatus Eisenbacteria bacterium]
MTESRHATGEARKGPSPFALLGAAQFLSQFGDSIFMIVLIWLLLEITGSKSVTGLAALISYLPALIFGVVAGFLVDRWNRRQVMLYADAARGLLLAAGGILYAVGALTAPSLTAIAFLCATAAVLFNPARDSILPELVRGERLVTANAVIQTSQQAAFFAGPLAASFVIQHGGVGAAFPVAVGLYGGSLLIIAAMGNVGHAHRATTPARPADDFREGLAAIRKDTTLLLLLAFTALDNLFIMGPALVGNAVMVRETLKGDAAMYALVEATYGLGWGLGTILLGKFARNISYGRLLLVGIVLDGITYIPLLWCRSFPYLIVVSFLHSMVIPLITVPRSVILQRIVPKERLGRVFALQNVVVVGMTALSSGLAGLALEYVDAPTLFGVTGAAAGLVGLAGFASRRLREL